MARPKLEFAHGNYTIAQIAEILDLSERQISRRIERGILPPPTSLDPNNTRYFNRTWLIKAVAILATPPEIFAPERTAAHE